jgi:cell division septal protein FtsQ
LFVLLGVTAASLWALWGYTQRAQIFRIKQIILPANASFTVRESLIGTSLWTLDARALSQELKRQQPWLKEVRVVRELPSTVRVETEARVPIAQVRLGTGWHLVDREGFILPQASAEPTAELVRLVGVGRGGSRIGDNADEQLLLALRVLQALQRLPSPLRRRISDIDVTEPRQLRFSIDGETEVRCGSEVELETQLQRLSAALKAIAKQRVAARYIDVRFSEPVVGPSA